MLGVPPVETVGIAARLNGIAPDEPDGRYAQARDVVARIGTAAITARAATVVVTALSPLTVRSAELI
jgi:hypothetical protein